MNPTVNFYLDRRGSEPERKLQIYLFLSYLKRNRLKAYTGLRVTDYCWDHNRQQYHTQRYKESSPRLLNQMLDQMKYKVIDAALVHKGAMTKEIIKEKIDEVRGNP